MVGTALGRYRVVEKLGAGGMGEVYRARDTRLDREVALKILPESFAEDRERLARFEREAKLLASLNHPGIATVYDLEEAPLPDSERVVRFLAMELIPGEDLHARLKRGALPPDEATRIAGDIAEALAAAHANGIVHRDLKPANVLLTPAGGVKVLDFGLAKLADVPLGETAQDSVTPTLTAAGTALGTVLGTAAYMSPEQSRGLPVDRRSDVWSFGVVLFELLAGEQLFKRDTIVDTLAEVVGKEIDLDAIPDGIAPEVTTLLQRCLDRDVDRRLADLGEAREILSRARHGKARRRPGVTLMLGLSAAVVVALLFGGLTLVQRLTKSGESTAPAASIPVASAPSIAVLPFITRAASADEQAHIFSAGIHDDLLTRLSRIEALTVISRTSVMQYVNTTKTMGMIAEELGVGTVLEGSVQRGGNRVRINVKLVDAVADRPLWADTYDEELTTSNIFAIQSDLTRRIAGALEAELATGDRMRLETQPTQSLAAYDFEVQGRFQLAHGTLEGMRRAVELFERAIAEDELYAPAWAGLSMALNHLVIWHLLPGDESLRRSRSAAERALALDGELAVAHVAMGFVQRTELDYQGAEGSFRRAIELSPGNAEAHASYAELLKDLGRAPEALRENRRAIELDPMSKRVRLMLPQVLYFARDFQAAVDECRRILQLDPDNEEAYYWMGLGQVYLGDVSIGLDSLKRAGTLNPESLYYAASIPLAHAIAGDEVAARRALAEAPELPLVEIALILGHLGEFDAAFDKLDRAYREKPVGLYYLRADPAADPLRSDPRWEQFLARVAAGE